MKGNPASNLNPLIADTPAETIDNATNALRWLESLTPYTTEAYGGTPVDGIQMGRYLLGQCCLDALEFAHAPLSKKPLRSAA